MYDWEAEERAERERSAAFQQRIADTLAALPVKTAETMAKAAYEVVRDECAAEGMTPDIECFMKTPEESGRYMGGVPGIWIVAWESGPYTWGIGASMAIVMQTGKLVETHYGFDLQFYPAED